MNLSLLSMRCLDAKSSGHGKKSFFWVMANFKGILCGLPYVHGAINYTQIHIQKSKGSFVANHFSYKLKVHNIHMQAIINHGRWFRDVFVRLSKSMNISRIIRLFSQDGIICSPYSWSFCKPSYYLFSLNTLTVTWRTFLGIWFNSC
jgi:hypothetical protein